MKKIVSLLLLAAMMVLTLASCGSAGFDYKANASKYVIKLADYENTKLAATLAQLAAIITDDDVKDEINEALISGKAYLNKIKEGNIAWGDTIGLTYKGVLASNVEALATTESSLEAILANITDAQINALTAFEGGEAKTETTLQIGSGQFIDGFEAAMVGMKLGQKNQSLVVTFPEDYSEKTLAGKKAVFFVSPTYKLQLETVRPLKNKDTIAATYEIKLAEGYEGYAEYFEDQTEGKETKIFSLSQDSQFHMALKLAFNEMLANLPEGAESEAFETEITFRETHVVSHPNADDSGKEQSNVLVDYTVTVHALSTPLYYTADDAASNTLKFSEFLTYLGLKEADYKDKTYTDYFKEKKEEMQKARTLQITANRYQAAFDALVEASEIDMDNEVIKELVQAYIDEVNGNIAYMVTYLKASGYASLYESMLSYYGCKDLEEYVMYTEYGYKKATITTQLKTDAEEYVASHLVFWALVEEKGITLTDEEYNAKLEDYKKLYENDKFVEDNNIPEEALREAMLWDKVAAMLAGGFDETNSTWTETYTTFTERPVAGEEEEDDADDEANTEEGEGDSTTEEGGETTEGGDDTTEGGDDTTEGGEEAAA